MTNQDMASLLKEVDFKIPKVGETVVGKVLSVSRNEVRLDIAGMMVGVVRGRELYFDAPEYSNLKIGDEVEATVVELDNENGELELSFKRAGQEKTWQNLAQAYRQKTSIKVKVHDANRGGLIVNYHQVQGFLPVSQLSPENYPRISGGDKLKIMEKLKALIGSELEVKIIGLDIKENKLVFSEKDAWQETKRDLLDKCKVGDIVEGKISAVTNFGLFVNFNDDLEGLIHISELSWQRIDDPSDYYKVGDTIKAEIISIEGSKIFLSAKKLLDDPWKKISERYQVGQKVQGKILKVNPFGLFVELDKDIHALAHVSQLNIPAGQKINEKFNVGDSVSFVITSIDPQEHRMGLELADEANAGANISQV